MKRRTEGDTAAKAGRRCAKGKPPSEQAGTARREGETARDASEDRIAIVDKELRIARANAAMAAGLGLEVGALVGRPCCPTLCESLTGAGDCLHAQTLKTGQPQRREIARPKGSTLVAETFPLRDATGEAVACLHVARDVTTDRRMQSQMMQAEKMATLGRLVSGVAHELTNPLTSVVMYSRMLLGKRVPQSMRGDLERIASESVRAARIVQNLLTFARAHPPERVPTDPNRVIEEALELRQFQLRAEDIEVACELSPGLPTVLADGHLIQQVLLNLISNAQDAMLEQGSGRRLTVRSESDESVVRVMIADTGAGVRPEIAPHIFEPFFTTKELGKGTGLGLSISAQIAEQHEGRLYLRRSGPPETEFVLELPIAGREAKAETGDMGAASPPGPARILMVEDEFVLSEAMRVILVEQGHQVDQATNAEQALQMLARQPYDMLITDLKMPGIGGAGLWEAVRRRWPRLARRVMFSTGDVTRAETQEFLEQTGSPVLTKPFMPEELVGAVARVLSNGGYR